MGELRRKSVVYITAPYRTRDLVTAAEASEEAAVENIYDLHLDRDYQLHSPWQQWNTEAGPHEPGRAMIEDYHRQFPDQGPLTKAQQARLPGHTPRPHGPAVRPADPVDLLHASARQIDQRERTPYATPNHTSRDYGTRTPAGIWSGRPSMPGWPGKRTTCSSPPTPLAGNSSPPT